MAERTTNSPEPTKLPYRAWRDDVAANWRRFTANITRENLISNLKTLAWVIPLTLLIWIWAEREQVAPQKDVAVPFELTSADPNRAVSLRPMNPPQDSNLVLELSGPQGRLQELVNKLHGGQMPQGLKLEVPTSYSLNQDYTVRTLELVANQRIFSDYGVTVQSAQPLRLEISVDKLVESDAKIVVPPNMKNVEAVFEPPMVKVRGPQILLNRAAQNSTGGEHGQLVVLAEGLPRTPGAHDVPEVVVAAPDELKDDRVKINEGHVKVRASVTVSLADKTLKIPSLPVTNDTPFNVSSKFDVVCDRPAVQNVTLIGPPEIIDLMQKPGFEPQPKGRLVITAADLINPGDRHTRVVQYDLPPGVHVSPEDEKKTVDFRVVDRSATQTP